MQIPDILGENHEIEKHTHRLRQFDNCETPFMNKYGNANSFIIIFGRGRFSGREDRGKSLSVTTHCIPRNVTAMFYKFAIIQFLISQLYIKQVCEQYFNHVQGSEGNGGRINGYTPPPPPPPPPMYVDCEEKQVECNTDHIRSANHRLKT